MNDRYFFVVFSGFSEDDVLNNGKMEYLTPKGKYPNEIGLIKTIEQSFNITEVFIKGISEVTKKDYNDWVEGREPLPDLYEITDDGGFL